MANPNPELTFKVCPDSFGGGSVDVCLYADGVYQYSTRVIDGPFLGLRLWLAKRFLRKKFRLIGGSR